MSVKDIKSDKQIWEETQKEDEVNLASRSQKFIELVKSDIDKYKIPNSFKIALLNISIPNDQAFRYRKLSYLNAFTTNNFLFTITTNYKIINHKNNKSMIYAFCYSIEKDMLYEDIEKEKQNVYPENNIENNGYVHRFFNISPSLLSMDGEYRFKFLTFENLRRFQVQFKVIFDAIESHILPKLNSNNWEPMVEYFYPTDKVNERGIESFEVSIEMTRMQVNLFICSFYCELYKRVNNLTENHINPKYHEVIFDDYESDIELYKKLETTHGKDMMKAASEALSKTALHRYDPGICKLGQKLIPLNLWEVQAPLDIGHKPWREILISSHLNNCSARIQAYQFPLFTGWFYIKNSRKGLFDNEVQYKRMDNSEKAKVIGYRLSEAQDKTLLNIVEDKQHDQEYDKEMKDLNKSGETEKEYVNAKFKKLYDKINDILKFSKEEIAMSNVCLGYTSEYTGVTFSDAIQMNHKSNEYREYSFDWLNNKLLFHKLVFDVIYGLMVMHTEIGIMHGDLHLNNCTIYKMLLGSMKDKDLSNIYVLKRDKDNKHIHPDTNIKTGSISNEDQVYIFKHKYFGITGTIIDYSRAIILPEKVKQFENEMLRFAKTDEYLANIKILHDPVDFHKDQCLRLMNYYENNFPDINAEDKERLQILINHKFHYIFKLFSILDVYSFINKLRIVLNIPDAKVDNANLILLNNITNQCEFYLKKHVTRFLENHKDVEYMEDAEYPVVEVMRVCFQDYIVNDPKDIGKIGNILLSSGISEKVGTDKYDELPDFMRPSKVNKSDYNPAEFWNKKLEGYRLRHTSLIAYIAERHVRKNF